MKVVIKCPGIGVVGLEIFGWIMADYSVELFAVLL